MAIVASECVGEPRGRIKRRRKVCLTTDAFWVWIVGVRVMRKRFQTDVVQEQRVQSTSLPQQAVSLADGRLLVCLAIDLKRSLVHPLFSAGRKRGQRKSTHLSAFVRLTNPIYITFTVIMLLTRDNSIHAARFALECGSDSRLPP
jgi:hypothetical protein